ncbi:hypothetical protein M0R72_09130 [Candidatus Pacearchaeota archaeon]|jgi:hypothetical protein|nr:hypothetical protein [Candidatus Pacearchaeota archaeon]
MAKKTGYLISEEDYRIFQKLIARERAREQVPRNRPVSYVPGLDHTAPEIYIAKPKTSIAALASAKPGEGLFEAYQIQDNSEGDPELFSVGGLEKLGFNLSSSALSTSTYYILLRDKFGNWLPVVGSSDAEIVECELTEDHPGKDVVFEIQISAWDSDSDGWVYAPGTGTSEVGHGIDRRSVPDYPLAGARGLFMKMPSLTYGILYECVSLDCVLSGT